MVDAFIHCYETEMKQWSGREKPHLSGKKYDVTLLAFGYEPLHHYMHLDCLFRFRKRYPTLPKIFIQSETCNLTCSIRSSKLSFGSFSVHGNTMAVSYWSCYTF